MSSSSSSIDWILGGMLGAAPLLSIFRRTASLSYFVTVREFGGKRPIEQTIGGRTIGHLTAGQQEGNRATAGVGPRGWPRPAFVHQPALQARRILATDNRAAIRLDRGESAVPWSDHPSV